MSHLCTKVLKMKQVPAILYFERIDVREQLDYSGLPDQLDPSILSLDTSISV
jgi:PAB-dependent poly(A)-specific ribonuclease subunit 2